MVLQSDYQYLLSSVYFVGGAGADDLSTISGELNQRADIGIDGNGDYQFYYYLLSSLGDLDALGYYASGSDREYTQLPSGGPALSADQSTIISGILSASTWGVSFSDVAKIDFISGSTSTADIVFGATTNSGSPNLVSTTGGYELDYSDGNSALKHGDVWLNNDFDLGTGDLWGDTSIGGYAYYIVLHEILHSLGLDHPSAGALDSMQYTVMSTSYLAGMNVTGTADDVLSSGLQLLDIAALQAIYGTNYSTRAGATTYKQGQGFGATVNDAFIYTIWDGGGTDTIDASGYVDGVVIDLREGHFSSIGKAADSSWNGGRGTGLAMDNVAVAYNAEIENAIGTDQADTLIGNELNNILNGGDGADEYVFTGAFGADVIQYDWSSTNIVTLDENLSLGEISFATSGDDFIITQGSNQITLKDFQVTSGALFPKLSLDGGVTDLDVISYSDYNNNVGNPYWIPSQYEIILANGGNDTIWGAPNKKDYIYGGSGHDVLYDRYGGGLLNGGTGNDYLHATVKEGNFSEIYGGTGDDDLIMLTDYGTVNAEFYADGGADDDSYYIRPGNVAVTVTVEDILGDERYIGLGGTLSITDESGDDLYETENYSRILNINDAGGVDLLRIKDAAYWELDGITESSNDLILHMPNGDIIIEDYFLSNDKKIENIKFTNTGVFQLSLLTGEELLIIGTDGGDVALTGTNASEKILGLVGDDTLIGGAGNDTLDGGDGTDTADYSTSLSGVVVNLLNSNWTYDGSNSVGANTAFDGEGGTDSLSSIENIIGSAYGDYLRGSNSASAVIMGGAGNDTIIGQALADELHGGDGDDIITGNGGGDLIYGDAGADILNGSGGNDTIYGGAGNDQIYGQDGADILYGDNGNDTIRGQEGDDEIHGGDGDDFLVGGHTGSDSYASNDTIYGDAGNDWLNGLKGDDTLYGGTGTDTLVGHDGNDALYGGDGADTLTGGAGADTFVFLSGETGVDTVTDFTTAQNDKLDVSDLLSGYDPLTDLITDFVQITDNGTHSFLAVDADGGANNFVQIAQLSNVTGLTDETALQSSGLLIAA